MTPTTHTQTASKRERQYAVIMEKAESNDEFPSFDEEMEYQYMPTNYIKTSSNQTGDEALDIYLAEWDTESKRARQVLDVELDVPYAPTSPRTRLDIYKPKASEESNNPTTVLIYIHGGYWEQCSKTEHGLGAFPILQARGGIAAVIDYDLLPNVTLDEIVNQTHQAVDFIANRYPNSRIYIYGHSAGGHLASMLMTKSEWAAPQMPSRIKGLCLVAGVFDPLPILRTHVFQNRNIGRSDALRNSPMALLRASPPTFKCPVRVIVAENDPPLFIKMSKDFLKVLQSHHLVTSYAVLPGLDHFSTLNSLTDPQSQMSKEICEMMMTV